MQRDSEKSRKSWELGNEIIVKYLEGKIEGTDKIRVAQTACNIHARMVASEANMETNRLVLGKMIYSDEKELKKYIQSSMPQMMIEKK
jgi:hypothetical protein